MAKPFATISIPFSKKQIEEITHIICEYRLDDSFSDLAIKRSGHTYKSLSSKLVKDPEWLENIVKNISSELKEHLDSMIDDPYGYSLVDDLDCKLLNEVMDEIEEVENIIEHERELISESKFTPELKQASELLKKHGFKVIEPQGA